MRRVSGANRHAASEDVSACNDLLVVATGELDSQRICPKTSFPPGLALGPDSRCRATKCCEAVRLKQSSLCCQLHLQLIGKTDVDGRGVAVVGIGADGPTKAEQVDDLETRSSDAGLAGAPPLVRAFQSGHARLSVTRPTGDLRHPTSPATKANPSFSRTTLHV